MKFPTFLLAAHCLVSGLPAQDKRNPMLVSPDGRFAFHAYSSEEADSGKTPNFGIIERASGKLISDPKEELGDAFRPEETILWSPDSRSYALTSRVGTRHLDTFLYRWDGQTFRRAKRLGGSQLEKTAGQRITVEIRAKGYPKDTARGRTIAGDCLPERWLDPRRLVMRRVEEMTVSGEARASVVWDEKSRAYTINKMLPVAESWPTEVEETPGFEVKQLDVPGDDPNARKITAVNRKTNETKAFTADGWLNAPKVLVSENGWPQIELLSHGPDEFLWRKLYRVEEGDSRCVRIDEMTRMELQAPEGGPIVKISEGFEHYIIRTRQLKKGELDTMESFFIETPSPDRKWKTVALYTPQYLERVSIVDAVETTEPVVLYDFESGEGSVSSVCQTLWSPDSQALAFYHKEGPRVGGALLYRRSDKRWSKAAMPKIDYGFIKGGTQNWRHKFETPCGGMATANWWRS